MILLFNDESSCLCSYISARHILWGMGFYSICLIVFPQICCGILTHISIFHSPSAFTAKPFLITAIILHSHLFFLCSSLHTHGHIWHTIPFMVDYPSVSFDDKSHGGKDFVSLSQNLKWGFAWNRCSINDCWMNEFYC